MATAFHSRPASRAGTALPSWWEVRGLGSLALPRLLPTPPPARCTCIPIGSQLSLQQGASCWSLVHPAPGRAAGCILGASPRSLFLPCQLVPHRTPPCPIIFPERQGRLGFALTGCVFWNAELSSFLEESRRGLGPAEGAPGVVWGLREGSVCSQRWPGSALKYLRNGRPGGTWFLGESSL